MPIRYIILFFLLRCSRLNQSKLYHHHIINRILSMSILMKNQSLKRFYLNYKLYWNKIKYLYFMIQYQIVFNKTDF